MSASTPTMRSVEGTTASALEQALERLTSLRQYQHQGKRVPHKPLLVLLALGQLEATGSSAVTWEQAQTRLAITWRLRVPMPTSAFEIAKVVA